MSEGKLDKIKRIEKGVDFEFRINETYSNELHKVIFNLLLKADKDFRLVGYYDRGDVDKEKNIEFLKKQLAEAGRIGELEEQGKKMNELVKKIDEAIGELNELINSLNVEKIDRIREDWENRRGKLYEKMDELLELLYSGNPLKDKYKNALFNNYIEMKEVYNISSSSEKKSMTAT